MQDKKTKTARPSKLAADELVRADIWQRVDTGDGRPARFERVMIWLPARPSASTSASGEGLNKT